MLIFSIKFIFPKNNNEINKKQIVNFKKMSKNN